MTKYSYVVLRYLADRGAGEALNIGVVVYSHEARFLHLEVDSKYERLSHAFAKFDGRSFRRAVVNLKVVFKDAQRQFKERPLFTTETSFVEWLQALVPDTGASLMFTTQRHGVTDNLEREVDLLYTRMVEAQKGQSEEVPRRDDATVWRTYQPTLPPALSSHLKSVTLRTKSVKVDFDHAVKNGAWHVIQPVSMDFKQAESMQRKASQWVGAAVGLKEAPELGTIVFLLGSPESGAHRQPYERAKALLGQAPGQIQIIEEKDAARLAPLLEQLLDHRD